MVKLWIVMTLSFALVLALSVATLGTGRQSGSGARHTLSTLAVGLVVGAVGAVLAFLAVWPPLHLITTLLPLAFLALLLGLLYFVRATRPRRQGTAPW